MNTLTVSLGDLIDRTLLELQAPSEQGLLVVLGEGGLPATSTVTCTLADASSVAVTDILQFGHELMLVTAKSADPVPVLTLSRGYYGSPRAVHAESAVGFANPQHARYRVAEAVKRSFARLEALGLPLVVSTTLQRETGLRYAELPAGARQVLRVQYVSTRTGQIIELDRWKFHDTLPVAKFPTGKVLELPRTVADADELEVTYQVPYRWSTFPAQPDEAATVTILEGAEDLPASYAAAWLLMAREVSRTELDRSTEWSQSEPSRNGTSRAIVRDAWQNFYRALDEARRLYVPPAHRPFIKMPRT